MNIDIGIGPIIGIVVGVSSAILLLGVYIFVKSRDNDENGSDDDSRKKKKSQNNNSGSGGSGGGNRHNTGTGDTRDNESLAGGLGDQSVATVDYDYSKAYGGGGDSSVAVSSAGGTFGSATRAGGAQSTILGEIANAAASGASVDSGSVGYFPYGGNHNQGGGGNGHGHGGRHHNNKNIKEELIDVYAPPGKLGVVIDTPREGAPIVHAVKETSVIADQLQVGDRLVAIDDEDVRTVTAINVSKMIAKKSGNPTRKLSIIRTVVLDDI